MNARSIYSNPCPYPVNALKKVHSPERNKAETMTLREKLSSCRLEMKRDYLNPVQDSFVWSGKNLPEAKADKNRSTHDNEGEKPVDPLLESLAEPIRYFLQKSATGQTRAEADLLELDAYLEQYSDIIEGNDFKEEREKEALTDFVADRPLSGLSKAELSFIQAILLLQLLR